MTDYELIHDEANGQYIFKIDEYVADLVYKSVGENTLKVTHVGVPPELGGKGIASQLTEKALVDIEKRGFHIIPICPFVVSYIERHPDWQRIVRAK